MLQDTLIPQINCSESKICQFTCFFSLQFFLSWPEDLDPGFPVLASLSELLNKLFYLKLYFAWYVQIKVHFGLQNEMQGLHKDSRHFGK